MGTICTWTNKCASVLCVYLDIISFSSLCCFCLDTHTSSHLKESVSRASCVPFVITLSHTHTYTAVCDDCDGHYYLRNHNTTNEGIIYLYKETLQGADPETGRGI
ncbi:predicted protein [Micromonas commoda]|uniref:Uncharacterized protein n=1 Tax=Micromonas commoda (strain RCC299 / NOUM17 / CCMP2709) TaxID=296587 RepID=C1FEN1_MICCC|nr:predicted protein [Micromonas commoda]ACO68598.1 predicted protein [Micromonas commoda]|eukprot:XP_002507340.1 predicted protein [Micromonas commoda]